MRPRPSNPVFTSHMDSIGLKLHWVGLTVGKWPIIGTPKEPSLGKGSVGVAAGDFAGEANIVWLQQ